MSQGCTSSHGKNIIYTDGALINDGTPHALSGFGVFWGKDSAHNLCGSVQGSCGLNVGELVAIEQALKQVTGLDSLAGSSFIIRTSSPYCLDSITKRSRKWVRNDWKTNTGQPVKNQAIFKRILALEKLARGQGSTVEFELEKRRGQETTSSCSDMANRLASTGAETGGAYNVQVERDIVFTDTIFAIDTSKGSKVSFAVVAQSGDHQSLVARSAVRLDDSIMPENGTGKWNTIWPVLVALEVVLAKLMSTPSLGANRSPIYIIASTQHLGYITDCLHLWPITGWKQSNGSPLNNMRLLKAVKQHYDGLVSNGRSILFLKSDSEDVASTPWLRALAQRTMEEARDVLAAESLGHNELPRHIMDLLEQ